MPARANTELLTSPVAIAPELKMRTVNGFHVSIAGDQMRRDRIAAFGTFEQEYVNEHACSARHQRLR